MKPFFFLLFLGLLSAQTLFGQTQHLIDSLYLALSSQPTSSDTLALAKALNLYGESLAKNNLDDLAKSKFLEALALFPLGAIVEELGYTYNNLGTLLSRNNDPGSAIQYTNEAIRLFSEILGPTHLYIGVITKNVAIQHGFVKGPEEKLKWLMKSDSILELHLPEVHPLRLEVGRLTAQSYIEVNQPKQAIRIYKGLTKTIANTEPVNHQERLFVYEAWAGLMGAQPSIYSIEETTNTFETTILFSEKELGIGHPSLRNIYNNYATFLTHKTKQNNVALKYFQKSIACQYSSVDAEDIFDLHSFNDIQNPSLQDLTLLSNKGALLQSLFEENNDLNYLESAFSVFMLGDSVAQQVKYEVLNQSSRLLIKESYNRFYIFFAALNVDLFNLTKDRKYLAKLYENIEKIKNWELVEQYKSIDFDQYKQDSFFQRINALGKNIKKNTLVDEQKGAGSVPADQLEMQQLYNKYPNYFEMLFGFEVKPLREVEQFCRTHNEQWIQYFYLTPGSLGIILCTPDTTVIHIGMNQNQSIVDDAKGLRHAIQQKDWSFVAPAHRLYRQLIQPIERYLTHHTLIITPHRGLNDLPFEALLTDSVVSVTKLNLSESFLLNQFDIRYQTSGSMGLMIYQPNNSFSKAVFIAPEYIDPDLQLSRNIEEVEKAQSQIGGDIYQGPEATKITFQKEVGNHHLIHFAGHTFTHPSRLDSIYLLLDDGRDTLFMNEILSMKSNAPLVILSSCKSAIGKEMPEAQMGVSYGFALAGTPNMISTLWNVSDRASSDIFNHYYSFLSNGSSSSTALTLAKRAFLKAAPTPAKHPFYWANAVYYGHPLNYQKKSSVLTWWLLGAIVLLTVVLVLRKKNRSVNRVS